jgi:hypothetical protein
VDTLIYLQREKDNYEKFSVKILAEKKTLTVYKKGRFGRGNNHPISFGLVGHGRNSTFAPWNY